MPQAMQVLEQRFAALVREMNRRVQRLENRLSVQMPDTSIPSVPAFGAATTTSYQSPSDGKTKAAVQLNWTTPTNTDGSPIIDGGYYEISYRPDATASLATTWSQLAGYTWGGLGTWGNPLSATLAPTPHYLQVNADLNTFEVKELTPGVLYDIAERRVDGSIPPNPGAWSTTLQVTAAVDTVAPSQPAPPTVAASLISVQVTSTLGKASGGTFNLESDLHHLEVHGSYEPGFVPSSTTLLGKLVANAGLLTAQIPAVGTFGTALVAAPYIKIIAVDISGNKSAPSAAASATAQLIDDQHISSLTVSKLLAGTVTASIILAGSIKTATTGARAEIDNLGIRLYDVNGNQTVNLSAADGSAVLTGKVQTSFAPNANAAVVMDPQFVAPGAGAYPTLVLYDGFNVIGPARLNATAYGTGGSGGTQTGLNSGPSAAGTVFSQSTALMRPDGWVVKFNDGSGTKMGGFVSGDSLGGHLGVTNSSGTQRSALDVNSDGTFALLSNVFSGAGVQVDGAGDLFVSATAGASLTLSGPGAVFLSGGSPGSLSIDGTGTYGLLGKFQNFVSQSSTSALASGQFSVTSNNGVIITWGSTMASTMVPICTMQNGSGGAFATVTGNNSTNFTMTANVTATQTFNWWAFRV